MTRDREVDTKAILERQLKRYPEMRARLDGTDTPEQLAYPVRLSGLTIRMRTGSSTGGHRIIDRQQHSQRQASPSRSDQ